MPYALLILWLAWVAQAVLSALAVRKFARRVGPERRDSFEAYRPRAAVVVPFKGLDADTPAALDGLLHQDYPSYRVVFVVESEDDPASPALRDAMARHAHCNAALVVAGVAPPTQGQKVHNQLAALRWLEAQGDDAAVWVFADSDAVPGPRWLADMVGPLSNEKSGATTGYRWLVPGGGGEAKPQAAGDVNSHSTPSHSAVPPSVPSCLRASVPASSTLWSKLASVLNSSVACLAGSRDGLNLVWGGSMAVRADFAREHGLVRRWTGAITDDYPVWRMVRDASRRVYFVRSCLVPSRVDFTFATFRNFVYRQYLITRVYAPLVHAAAVLLTGLYTAGFVSALVALAAAHGWLRWAAAGALAVVVVADQLRAASRAAVVAKMFPWRAKGQLQPALRLDRWGTPLWMAAHFLITLSVVGRRSMTWRGVRYVVRGPNDVTRV